MDSLMGKKLDYITQFLSAWHGVKDHALTAVSRPDWNARPKA
jgi:hypothetical protein